MKLFTGTTAESLGRKKVEILGIFTRTQEDLKKLRDEHNTHINNVAARILELTAEHDAVKVSHAETSKVIAKIDEFLS